MIKHHHQIIDYDKKNELYYTYESTNSCNETILLLQSEKKYFATIFQSLSIKL